MNEVTPREALIIVLDESISFVESMREVLNPLNSSSDVVKEQYRKYLSKYQASQNPEAWIWRHWNPSLAIESGERSGNYWPVNTGELSEICSDYLQKPWLQCGAIDRILVDAMIYQEALSFGEDMKPSLLGGGITGAVLSSISKSFSKVFMIIAVKGLLWWLVLLIIALFVGLVTADNYGGWAGLLAGFGFWVMLKVR